MKPKKRVSVKCWRGEDFAICRTDSNPPPSAHTHTVQQRSSSSLWNQSSQKLRLRFLSAAHILGPRAAPLSSLLIWGWKQEKERGSPNKQAQGWGKCALARGIAWTRGRAKRRQLGCSRGTITLMLSTLHACLCKVSPCPHRIMLLH